MRFSLEVKGDTAPVRWTGELVLKGWSKFSLKKEGRVEAIQFRKAWFWHGLEVCHIWTLTSCDHISSSRQPWEVVLPLACCE